MMAPHRSVQKYSKHDLSHYLLNNQSTTINETQESLMNLNSMEYLENGHPFVNNNSISNVHQSSKHKMEDNSGFLDLSFNAANDLSLEKPGSSLATFHLPKIMSPR